MNVPEKQFTEDEAAKLTYVVVAREVKRFKDLLDSGMDFDEAMKEVFGEENESFNNSSK